MKTSTCRSCTLSKPEAEFRTTTSGKTAMSCIDCEINKPCKVCGKKPPEAIFRFRKDKDGRREEKCRKCVAANTRKWLTVPENKGRVKQWKQNPESKEKHKQAMKRFEASEKGKQWRKNYVQQNKEKYKERNRLYYTKNLEKFRKKNRDRYKAHPEKENIRSRRRRNRKLQAEGFHTDQEWLDLLCLYEHTCLRCGKKEPFIKLTRDHIVPLSKGGNDYISNIQPLCRSCNSSKHTITMDYRGNIE